MLKDFLNEFKLKPKTKFENLVEIKFEILSNTVSQLVNDVKFLRNERKLLLEIIKLEKMSDKQLYKEYQYKLWAEIPDTLRVYLKERFSITNITNYGSFHLPICGKNAFLQECFGQTIERNFAFTADGIAKTPTQFAMEEQRYNPTLENQEEQKPKDK